MITSSIFDSSASQEQRNNAPRSIVDTSKGAFYAIMLSDQSGRKGHGDRKA
jgi:hypothetical protein